MIPQLKKILEFDDKWKAWREAKEGSLARDWLHGAATENHRLEPYLQAMLRVIEAAIEARKSLPSQDALPNIQTEVGDRVKNYDSALADLRALVDIEGVGK